MHLSTINDLLERATLRTSTDRGVTDGEQAALRHFTSTLVLEDADCALHPYIARLRGVIVRPWHLLRDLDAVLECTDYHRFAPLVQVLDTNLPGHVVLIREMDVAAEVLAAGPRAAATLLTALTTDFDHEAEVLVTYAGRHAFPDKVERRARQQILAGIGFEKLGAGLWAVTADLAGCFPGDLLLGDCDPDELSDDGSDLLEG